MKTIRAKPHRLPRDRYCGQVSATFTLCLERRQQFFLRREIVDIFSHFLREAAEQRHVHMIYTFMPDHLHVLSIGPLDESDGLRCMEMFKQSTGWWLRKNQPQIRWQKGFWDRIVRSTYEEAQAAWYFVNNPVRRGLVEEWTDYPFTGAIGIDLKEFLADLMPFT